jgi:hypothetical protein
MLSQDDRQLITNVRMQDSFELDGGSLIKTRTVTYSVGTQGPFVYRIPWAQFNPEVLSQEWQRQIYQLRSLGIIP